jgi:hypothetical protein
VVEDNALAQAAVNEAAIVPMETVAPLVDAVLDMIIEWRITGTWAIEVAPTAEFK